MCYGLCRKLQVCVACGICMAQDVRIMGQRAHDCFRGSPPWWSARRGSKALLFYVGKWDGAGGALQAPAWVLCFFGDGGRWGACGEGEPSGLAVGV